MTRAEHTGRLFADRVFSLAGSLTALACCGVVTYLSVELLRDGLTYLDSSFLTQPPSRSPQHAGVGPALIGTLWVGVLASVFALPLGLGTALLIEEYRPNRRASKVFRKVVERNLDHLTGVPSVVYGLLGLAVFVHGFGWFGSLSNPSLALGPPEAWYAVQLPLGRSVLAGGLTVGALLLPLVAVAARDALAAVPRDYRSTGMALGASRWQVTTRIVMPHAFPRILANSLQAIAKALGGAAPILIVAGVIYLNFRPQRLLDDYTTLPLQIFDWAGRPDPEFRGLAAAGILTLLFALAALHGTAAWIRFQFDRAHLDIRFRTQETRRERASFPRSN